LERPPEINRVTAPVVVEIATNESGVPGVAGLVE
jgi:hypothetical protein